MINGMLASPSFVGVQMLDDDEREETSEPAREDFSHLKFYHICI